MQQSQPVTISLSRSEALVLFEWLASRERAGDTGADASPAQRVLWRVEGQLESALPEVLARDYDGLVEAARRDVRDG